MTMTPEEHLRILGPQTMAEIEARMAHVAPIPPEILTELNAIFAPVIARRRTEGSATEAAA